MKSNLVKNSWDFKVTVTVPCPVCNEFVAEPDCKLRSEYVYGEGYVKLHCCEPCFTKYVQTQRAKVHTNPYGY
jgi:hypothetical protein